MTDTARAPRSRRWRRRVFIALGVLVVLLLVLRLTLPTIAKTVAGRVGASVGLEVSWDSLSLRLLLGRVELEGLVVRPAPAAPPDDSSDTVSEPWIALERAYVDLSVPSLASGRPRLSAVEIDGLSVVVERGADGRFLFERLFATDTEEETEAEDPGPPADAAAFALPLVIDRLAVTGARVRLIDRAVAPAVEEELVLDVTASHLGARERRGVLALDLRGETLLESLRVRADSVTGGPDLTLDLSVDLRGLRARDAAARFPTVPGLDVVAQQLDLSVAAEVTLSGAVTEAEDGTLVPTDGVQLNATVRAVSVVADGSSVLGLDHLRVTAPALGRTVHVARVALDGVRASVERTPDGAFAVPGLAAFDPAAASAPTDVDGAPPDVDGADADAAELSFRLDQLAIENVAVAVADRAQVPPFQGRIELDDVAVEGIRWPLDAMQAGSARVELALPPVVEHVAIDARATPSTPPHTTPGEAPGGDFVHDVELEVDVVGVDPRPLAGLLAPLEAAGVALTFTRGHLTLRADASVSVDPGGAARGGVELRELAFDAGGERLDLVGARVEGVRWDPAGPSLDVATVSLDRFDVRVTRDAAGVVDVAGVRWTPSTQGADAVPSTPADARELEAPSSGAGRVPAADPLRLHVAEVSLAGVDVELVDAALPGLSGIRGLALSATDFVLEGGEPQPTQIRLRVAVPGVASSIELDGELRGGLAPPTVVADMKLVLRGVTTSGLAPVVSGLPTLADGSLEVGVRANVGFDAGLAVDAEVSDLVWAVAGETGFELAGVSVTGFELAEAGPRVQRVVVDGPHVELEHDAGSWRVAGLALGTAPVTTAPVTTAQDEDAEDSSAAAVEPAGPIGTWLDALLAALPGQVEIRDVRAHVVDRSYGAADADAGTGREVTATLDAILSIDPLEPSSADPTADPSAAAPARTGSLRVHASVPGVDSVELDLTLGAGRGSASLVGALDVQGVRGPALASLLPPGLAVTLADGRVHADLSAGVANAAAGGVSGHATLENIGLSDGADGPALLKLGRVHLGVARADAAVRTYDVEEVVVAGLELALERRPDGALRGLGVELKAAQPARATNPADAQAEVDEEDDDDRGAGRLLQLLATGTRQPTLSLGRLDLELARLELRGFGGASATAHEADGTPAPWIGRAHLVSPERYVLLRPDPEDLPPIKLELRGAVEPFIGGIRVDVTARPQAVVPRAQIDLALSGLSGADLVSAVPGLEETLDLSAFRDGRFDAHMDVGLRQRGRSGLRVDPTLPFSADLTLSDIALRATDGGDPVIGLDALEAEFERVDVERRTVRVRSVEIYRPQAVVQRTASGLEVGGVLLRTPPEPAATGVATEASAPRPLASAPAGSRAGAEIAPTVPGEVRVDRLTLYGLDVQIVDRTADPPAVLPLNDADIEVSNLTTRLLVEPHPVRFRVALYAGEVSLPEHLPQERFVRGLVTGVVDTAAAVVPGRDDGIPFEKRPVWDEISVSGNLTLAPELEGRVRVRVSGLELTAGRSSAANAGVDVRDGTLDSTVDARFEGGGLDMRTHTVLSHLAVSESDNGPVRSFLRLPAPLNTVVFVLRNRDGEVILDLDFAVPPEGMSSAAVGEKATEVLGQLVARAIANSPFRVTDAAVDVLRTSGDVVHGVTDKVGLGGVTGLFGFGRKPEPPPASVAVAFLPAAVAPTPVEVARLTELAERLAEDDKMIVELEHAFGTADLERIEALANPPVADALQIAARLRWQRDVIEQMLQATGAARTAADSTAAGLGRPPDAEEVELMRALARTESGLDVVLELARVGADRGRDRRVRVAAKEVAQLRLAGVRAALLVLADEDVGDRLRLRPARWRPPQHEGGGRVTVTARVRR